MKRKNLNQLIEKYGERTPKEVVEALKEYQNQRDLLREECIKNEVGYLERIKQIKINLKFLDHELRTPLNSMIGFSDLMLQNGGLNNEQKEFLDYINKSSKEFLGVIDFANPDIASGKERIKIEEIFKEQNYNKEFYMNKNKIGTTMRYSPVEMDENKSIFKNMVKSLNENALLYVPEFSRIEQGIRLTQSEKLEALIENKIAPERREGFGKGEGVGQKTIRGFIKDMGGEFHTYTGKSRIIYNANQNYYNESKKFGNSRATNHISGEDNIYGVQIKIPLKNLREPQN